jgi:hypothetical protein
MVKVISLEVLYSNNSKDPAFPMVLKLVQSVFLPEGTGKCLQMEIPQSGWKIFKNINKGQRFLCPNFFIIL